MTPRLIVSAAKWASCRVSAIVIAARATCPTGRLTCSPCCMAIPGKTSSGRPKSCGLCWVMLAAITVFFTVRAFSKRLACAWPDEPVPENAPSPGGKHVSCHPLYQDADGADASGTGPQAPRSGGDLEPDSPLQSHL